MLHTERVVRISTSFMLNKLSIKQISEQRMKMDFSSIKWSVLAHLKSQPRGQNFQAPNLVEHSSPHYTRPNKNTNKHI